MFVAYLDISFSEVIIHLIYFFYITRLLVSYWFRDV